MRSLRIMRSLGLIWIAGVGLFGMAALAQAPSQPTTPFHPVGTMQQLMIDIIYPTSDALFYVDRDPPKNQQDWNVLRMQALTMAEAGNLLMMDGRARDQKNWVMESRMLIDIGAKAYKAAQAKDIDGIRALNDSLNAACVVCHYQYRPGYHRRRPTVETK
jgi:hypothetical protein